MGDSEGGEEAGEEDGGMHVCGGKGGLVLEGEGCLIVCLVLVRVENWWD